jgi:serine/threonine protein kinase
VRPVKVCEDGGKVDTYGLLVTLLHALSAVPVYWWAFTDPAASSADLELAEMWRFISKHQDHTEMCRALVHYYTPLLSRAALDFVKEVLVLDPSSRPTPAQVLAHPYLKEEPAAAG